VNVLLMTDHTAGTTDASAALEQALRTPGATRSITQRETGWQAPIRQGRSGSACRDRLGDLGLRNIRVVAAL
jgi:hypothetical protein